jgi:hypothetical protein
MFDPAARPIWWLPTLGFFLFVAIELAMFINPDRFFADPGVGRHLRTADFILETGRVPRADPLSFSKAGQPWVDYEWAFEATIGELNRAGGLGLVGAFATALFATTVLGVYRTVLQAGISLSSVVLVTALAFATLHLHYAVRPLLFTYLFMALVVEVWTRRRQPLRRDWIFLPIIFVAWANLHAGWAAGLVFLVCATAGRVIDRLLKRVDGDEAPVIPWIALTLLCTLAVSFNPWGWGLFRQVFLFATSFKSFALWNEYEQPNFTEPSMSAITILCLLVVIFAARAFRRAPVWRWEMTLPVLFFLYEGLKAQRHVLLLMEIAAVPMARDLDVLLHATWLPWVRDHLRQFQERQRLAGGDTWLSFLAALVVTALFVGTPIARHIQVGESATPQLLSFIKDHPDRFQRPLVTTSNAGPLLWNLRPNFRVSFDDRGDFYGDPTVFAFVDLYDGRPGWRKTLDQGNYDSAILDTYLPLGQMLTLLPDWKEAFRDKKTVIFWRARPDAASPL